jgi:hypothetical protein
VGRQLQKRDRADGRWILRSRGDPCKWAWAWSLVVVWFPPLSLVVQDSARAVQRRKLTSCEAAAHSSMAPGCACALPRAPLHRRMQVRFSRLLPFSSSCTARRDAPPVIEVDRRAKQTGRLSTPALVRWSDIGLVLIHGARTSTWPSRLGPALLALVGALYRVLLGSEHGKTVLAVRAGWAAALVIPSLQHSFRMQRTAVQRLQGRCGRKPSRVQAQIATPPGCVHMTLCPSGPHARGSDGGPTSYPSLF